MRNRFILVPHGLQLGFPIDGFPQCGGAGRVVGHQLGDPIDLPVRHFQHATDIAHHRAGLQLAEGDDLGHPVIAEFLLHVVDHLITALLAEIDIKIRHRHPFRVQETFEEQPKTQRIQIGDGQHPGDHGTSP